MTSVLVGDAQAVHAALATGKDRVQLSLARETAEMIARWLDAEAGGQQVVATKGLREVSPAEAASMMGMSRSQVHKLLDDGIVPFRMVGSHHRIRLDAINAWLELEDARQGKAMAELVALQNELGLTE
ncbi:MAG: excisionase family DNA-binding protein [Propionibacteriaceae bacterium]|nr:excisionase family DNA-binding protein [Propionibacteriaceae bacterium]